MPRGVLSPQRHPGGAQGGGGAWGDEAEVGEEQEEEEEEEFAQEYAAGEGGDAWKEASLRSLPEPSPPQQHHLYGGGGGQGWGDGQPGVEQRLGVAAISEAIWDGEDGAEGEEEWEEVGGDEEAVGLWEAGRALEQHLPQVTLARV